MIPKYKAWHKKEKKLYYVLGFTRLKHQVADDGDGHIDEWVDVMDDYLIPLGVPSSLAKMYDEQKMEYDEWRFLEYAHIDVSLDEIDLLQYIGRKDESGKRIYEKVN